MAASVEMIEKNRRKKYYLNQVRQQYKMKGLFDGNVLIGCFVYFVAYELALNLAKNILMFLQIYSLKS